MRIKWLHRRELSFTKSQSKSLLQSEEPIHGPGLITIAKPAPVLSSVCHPLPDKDNQSRLHTPRMLTSNFRFSLSRYRTVGCDFQHKGSIPAGFPLKKLTSMNDIMKSTCDVTEFWKPLLRFLGEVRPCKRYPFQYPFPMILCVIVWVLRN
jgi:hypothetical protein